MSLGCIGQLATSVGGPLDTREQGRSGPSSRAALVFLQSPGDQRGPEFQFELENQLLLRLGQVAV